MITKLKYGITTLPFSRKKDLTPIPMEDDVSSLSTILLDDAYYHFTVSHSAITDNLHRATEPALICLKAKAFLNNAARKSAGQSVRQDDIDKHKRNVIRVTAALTPGNAIETPPPIKADLQKYVDIIREENPDVRQILRAEVNIEQILELIMQNIWSLQLSIAIVILKGHQMTGLIYVETLAMLVPNSFLN